ncbi:UDP-glucuronic acid decarboxylase family protein [Pelosinus propionicus]|uniref:UDP-glucuronate decarboxylase n=1 Tax=Pelosinus propionicus DSM 13327 TaxID=1123291 RepID=A0A1I4JQR2_9FIRM|nr:UDP-glucuronic acid decarboxylase family protein [Pelosinus propionicus]SFL68918.1 UDP-glucuronate decarboxylase [Pelosinus propionicus DSM 13327]
MANKRILVTGGAGFIGSHLCKKLLDKGHEVICLDNYFTGFKANIEGLLNHPLFRIIQQDIIDPLDLEVDQIYNFACPASPLHYQHDPIKTLKTSIQGTINILDLAQKNQARVLHASTSEIYGDPLVHPQKEEYWGNVNPIGVRSCYDEGKRCAETLCYDYYRAHDLDIKVIRIFNTYGPNMHIDDGRVVSNFIVQALRGEEITIYGDGKQTRAFCYIDDLIDGILRMMETKKESFAPVNLGNPEAFSILELAEKVIRLTGSASKLIFKSLPEDDPRQRCPDIKLAEAKINWKPRIRLDDGLQETIAYFKKVLG